MYLIDIDKIPIEKLLEIEKGWENYFRSNKMCTTRYIDNLLAVTPAHYENHGVVQVSMKRSDGEIFTTRLNMLTKDEAEKVKKLFNYLEELRTCICTRISVCEKHSTLEKKS